MQSRFNIRSLVWLLILISLINTSILSAYAFSQVPASAPMQGLTVMNGEQNQYEQALAENRQAWANQIAPFIGALRAFWKPVLTGCLAFIVVFGIWQAIESGKRAKQG